MALQTKVKFLSQDKSGRKVVIKDATGLEANGVPTGYGINNGEASDIEAYYFVVSRMFDGMDYTLKIDGSNPLLPTPYQIGGIGLPVTLTTNLFEFEDERGVIEEPCDIFKDGVLDINMYVEFPGYDDLEIKEGESYIIGDDFTDAYKGDAIVVNDVIYQIDKSVLEPGGVGNQGGTILYIIGTFEEDATEFGILYRSNTKALLTSMSNSLHAYGTKVLFDKIESPEWAKINTAASFRKAAEILFGDEDYYSANDLVQSNFKLLKKYAI